MSDARDTTGPSTLSGVVRRAHRRMAWVSVAVAGTLVLLAGVVALRVYIDTNLQLVTRSLAYTVEAAVVFGDRENIRNTLDTMLADEGVAHARVLDARGSVLVQWHHPNQGVAGRTGEWLARHMLTDPQVGMIRNDGQLVGSVELSGDGQGLLGFLLTGMAALLVCMAISGAAGVLLSRRMLSDIVTPLQSLAEVARAARHERDLTLRVPPARIVELRALGDDFNSLLDELQQRQAQLQLQNTALAHQANHDSLTGLPNRAYFEQRLQAVLQQAQLEAGIFAVLFLDNDHFKQVNDTHGHEAGDALLVAVAQRIRSQLRESDLVARLGGDEFAVLLAPVRGADDATRIADKIIQAMASPLVLASGRPLWPSVSIGVAVYPLHGQDMVALLRSADTAMYHAKAHGRGTRHVAEVGEAGRVSV